MQKGCRFGVHRVVEPKGTLPQAAIKIDNTPEIYSNELLIDVKTLNIDSASFTQIKKACNHDQDKMKKMILDIVRNRGKMQNPVTGSGGMLIGTVKEIGPDFNDSNLKVGDKIATLVSLSLTPLLIKEIKEIKVFNDQVDVLATAILFESGIYSILPDDLPETLALAALDVAGAPAQVNKLVKQNDTVVIVGAAGKSGILCTYQAMKNAGPKGNVIAVVINEEQKTLLESLNLATTIVIADATKPTEVYEKIVDVTNGELSDVTINVVNVENTEMSCILSTKDTGTVYFFSMATSFTKAALGAEGVGSDVNMIIGNGYTRHHADLTLNLIRESKPIRQLLEKLYV
ncbi:L-erythro-3,5-diaminohexanoate dehydrogenase [Haloplasma contractile]|uniref:L-erythro-35-diaminohexanoate dehydrogenase protein n=1 Tax=Haloplasma contractile SSD-17B TaxID=1033810 RepID=F7PW09_9MOLU|nr:zinc-binding alcohol dehydrogenase [Haloplasma contractile]ERJ12668.1 L-erythro-35-diaminohexanoate dehydrogenase protein [Haloplasma contractile SSD-17B]